MGIFIYIYAKISSKAQIREKGWKSEKSMLKKWLQQYISRSRYSEPLWTFSKESKRYEKILSKFEVKTSQNSAGQPIWSATQPAIVQHRAESDLDSDSDWTLFSVLIITFATDVQFWWFKMLQKDDWKIQVYFIIFSNSIIWWVVFSNQHQLTAVQFRIKFSYQIEVGLKVLMCFLL